MLRYRSRGINLLRRVFMNSIYKGDLFYADLGETVGSEQSGCRPVLIIQNNVGNRYSPTVIVSPLTKQYKKMMQPTHVALGHRFGLTEDSVALLEQIRTIDRLRLRRYIGTVDSETMNQIDRAITISFGLKEEV
jgi:mRNA interferase MazF